MPTSAQTPSASRNGHLHLRLRGVQPPHQPPRRRPRHRLPGDGPRVPRASRPRDGVHRPLRATSPTTRSTARSSTSTRCTAPACAARSRRSCSISRRCRSGEEAALRKPPAATSISPAVTPPRCRPRCLSSLAVSPAAASPRWPAHWRRRGFEVHLLGRRAQGADCRGTRRSTGTRTSTRGSTAPISLHAPTRRCWTRPGPSWKRGVRSSSTLPSPAANTDGCGPPSGERDAAPSSPASTWRSMTPRPETASSYACEKAPTLQTPAGSFTGARSAASRSPPKFPGTGSSPSLRHVTSERRKVPPRWRCEAFRLSRSLRRS